jgi:DNA-binding CsgD family transcriptional regulator/tetratricopeptide (TPR) repeat protein
MQLLERESSLGALAGYAGEARRGDGRLVLVAGEAGVGKSALVEALARDLPDARWSWGACDGLFTPRPLGPLFDLADQLGGDLLELCRCQAAREELFRALLRQVSEPGTLNVVVVEDVHWADEATIDMLRFVGRRIKNASVLLIATFRDEDLAAGDPLRAALGELGRQGCTRRVELAPLSAGAVRQLASPAGLDADELYRLTGGNPFYVSAVIAAGVTEVPAAARDAVLARVVGLSIQGRAVLDAAALAGARADLRLVQWVTDCPPSAVDEVLASGLLAADGGWLRFRHEIARLAAEQAIPAYRQGAIHARILQALLALGCEDDARMAFHADCAGDGEAVLRYATSAAHRAAGLASHQEAAAQFGRALRFVAGADRATAGALYDGLAREASLIDRWQDAADAGEHALALWRELGNQLREGDAMRRLSRTMWRLCRGADSIAAAGSALEILQPLGPSTELAWAYANLAGSRMVNNEHDEAIGLARQARAIAESLGVSEVLSDALNTEGCALAGNGRDGTGRLREALQIAISCGLQEQAGRAFVNLDSIYCQQRRFAEAERSFAAGIAYCEDHDLATFATCLRGGRAIAMERTGQWEEAVALTEQLLGIVASPVNRLLPQLSLGKIRARRGDGGAWACLDEAAVTADGIAEPQYIIPARLARAEAYWFEGKHDLARSEAELADDVAASGDAWERGEVAIWLRRTGSGRSPRGELAEPCQRQVAGDPEMAAQLWTDLGCPYEAAMALQDSTEERLLRQALNDFTGLGAPAAARITRQKMRQLGIRSIPAGPRTATRAHPLGLTRREREVLDLICAGHTNAQIAAKLFISAKTVDHHVSAVLAKLDAPTRDVAASHAARLGLAGTAER